jgi:anti-sigma regulatory factor (Ser/Thr protein kinase)
MNTMAPTRPTALHQPTRPTALQKPLRPAVLQKRRVTLAAEPAAAGAARRQVQATIQAWEVPVDSSVAMLLTSELVTNAIMHETGETITLVITCAYGQLHVDVHDTSCTLPVPVDGPPDAETGRGLMLVANLSSSWGYYRTPTGKAVYFTLAFQDGLSGDEPGMDGDGPSTNREGPSVNGNAPGRTGDGPSTG